jgi:CRISPR-associated protein Cas2
MYVVIAYDIPDDKRRAKISKLLAKYAERKQFSLFEARLEEKNLQELRNRLFKLLSPGVDHLRIYRLCNQCLAQTDIFGKLAVEPDREYYIA